MKATLRERGHGDQRSADARRAAYEDARALALELGRRRPDVDFDAMAAGVVPLPGETVYRRTAVWLYLLDHGCWGEPARADMLITDCRLLCRLPDGQLASLPWAGLVGLDIDLRGEHVVLDHGDGHPVSVSGSASAVVAVAAVAFIYGVRALVSHPALESLRTGGREYHATTGPSLFTMP